MLNQIMSKNIMKNSILILLTAILLSSCVKYKDIQYKAFEGVEVEKMEGSDMIVGVNIKVLNPNNYPINIDGKDLKASFNGKELSNVGIINTIKLDANKESSQKILIKIPKQTLITLAPMALFSGGKIKLDINGEVKARVFLFSKKFPVNFSQNVNLGDFK